MLSPFVSSYLQGLGLSAGLIIAIGAQNAHVLRTGLLRRHVGLTVIACILIDVFLICAGIAGMGALIENSPLLLGLATLIALVLFALPPIITNAYVGVRQVDRDLVEASRGMGMSGWQVFRGIEGPLSTPVVITGLRLALVQVWATATIAALVAGPGLGRIITRGFDNRRTYEVLAGALLVAVGALILEGLAVLVERLADPMRAAKRQGT